MKNLMALLVSLSLAANCLATECLVPVKSLDEGSPAQCKGFLFSPSNELEVRLMKKDYDLVKLEVETTNAIIDRYKNKDLEFAKIVELETQKSEIWKTRAEDITLKYVSLEDSRGRRDLMFVLAGVGLTVLSAWAVGQVAKGNK